MNDRTERRNRGIAVRGWVWCVRCACPHPAQEDKAAWARRFHVQNEPMLGTCSGPHHPLYIARPSAADQPLPDAEASR